VIDHLHDIMGDLDQAIGIKHKSRPSVL
jgi:hypothetical protein